MLAIHREMMEIMTETKQQITTRAEVTKQIMLNHQISKEMVNWIRPLKRRTIIRVEVTEEVLPRQMKIIMMEIAEL